MASLRDQCAIVGVGETKYSRRSGVSTLALASECSLKAIQDAGLSIKGVDGIILFYMGEPVSIRDLAENLGIRETSFQLTVAGGGNNGCAIVATAAAVIQSGLAKNVVCLYAENRRSGIRFGASGFDNFARPFGKVQAPHNFALWAQRHMKEFGTKPEHLGAIAITCRKHASLNEKAIMRSPITMQDYLSSRMITTPFRLLDCCLESDGGAACVVTSSENARNLRKRPVLIMGAVANSWGMATDYSEDAEGYCSIAARGVAPKVFGMAGVAPKDMDFAQIYDCFTYTVLAQLEDYGFCKKGEGGPFVEGGARLGLEGELPLNTSGGALSEAYVRTMNLINEAVRQLRGECGPRQVRNAEIGLVTSAANPASALILRR